MTQILLLCHKHSPSVPFAQRVLSSTCPVSTCRKTWQAGAPTRGTFPTGTEVPVEMSLCRRLFRGALFSFKQNTFHMARQVGSGEWRCLLVAIFPSGKTSATGAPPVGEWEAGDRCRCAQFWDIRLIGMLLGCLEGLPVWRVFCWKQFLCMFWLSHIPAFALPEKFPTAKENYDCLIKARL